MWWCRVLTFVFEGEKKEKAQVYVTCDDGSFPLGHEENVHVCPVRHVEHRKFGCELCGGGDGGGGVGGWGGGGHRAMTRDRVEG